MSTEDAMIEMAVIGCGEWGPNHIRNFQSQAGAKVRVAVDLDPKRLQRIRELFPAVDCSADLDAVLSEPGIQAVVVATPLQTHYKLVKKALLAGKHVLCEKPLCPAVTQAQELVDLAEARELVLMVGHVFLFNPGIMKVKEILESGGLGNLHYMHAVRTNLGPIRRDCNAAFDLATHDISIFNWLVGSEPLEVSATGGCFLQPGIEDVVSISLKYPGDVFGSIQASWLNPKKVRQITVVGSKQMVTWDDLQLGSPVACYDKGANSNKHYDDFGEFLRIATWDGDVKLPKVHAEEPLKLQARHFLDAIAKGGAERSGGDSALGVVAVLQAAAKSLLENGHAVPVESGRAVLVRT
jgi:predicted dehydrogenase